MNIQSKNQELVLTAKFNYLAFVFCFIIAGVGVKAGAKIVGGFTGEKSLLAGVLVGGVILAWMLFSFFTKEKPYVRISTEDNVLESGVIHKGSYFVEDALNLGLVKEFYVEKNSEETSSWTVKCLSRGGVHVGVRDADILPFARMNEYVARQITDEIDRLGLAVR